MNVYDVIVSLVDLAEDCDQIADWRARTGHSGPDVKRCRDHAIACTQASLWLTQAVAGSCQVTRTGDKVWTGQNTP